MAEKYNVVLVSGARPNFMKIAPLLKELERHPGFEPALVHTGQHYDEAMATSFFRDLGIRQPDHDLEVGSASHAVQTGTIMIRFDEYLDNYPADLVVVVGDVNSTIACTLTAVKRSIPVAHVEAGLRSFDRAMPEEINRILTDSISDFLFTTESDAEKNLLHEGIDGAKIHFVGNLMVDSLLEHKRAAVSLDHELPVAGRYALATVHRPSNVDEKGPLGEMVTILTDTAKKLPVIFPVHPRTAAKLGEFGFTTALEDCSDIHILAPSSYLRFVRLMVGATMVLTDSGGIQEETTALGIPCITLRENTERPITVSHGTNEVCGRDTARIANIVESILDGRGKSGIVPEKWDGKAAKRLVKVLFESLD